MPIALVGIPPTDSLGRTGVLGPLFARHADRLNALTRQSADGNRRASFIALPGMQDSQQRPEGSPEAYRVWGEAIVAGLLPLLTSGSAAGGRPPVSPTRALAAAALDPVNAAVRERLQDLAVDVRMRTDADLVLVNLLDDDRLWDVADSLAGRPRSISLSDTFCASTLLADVMRVPDVHQDARFETLPRAALDAYSSYAGVVLRDAHGTAVGTLCMFNGGVGASIGTALLRRAGRDVEAQLAQLVSPVDRGTLFPQRAASVEGDASMSAVVHDPALIPEHAELVAVTARTAISEPSDDVGRTSVRAGWWSRWRRLRTEGRALTATGADRPVPTERDVRLQGPHPIRVLLVGGDYAVGYGARTRIDALDGAIARLLHTRTGRGVIVENRSQRAIRLEHLASSLGPAGAHTFDLVVWTPTFEEGARAPLRSRWVTGLGLMLRKIESTSSASTVLMGFPSLLGAQPLAVLGRTRAIQINRVLRFTAARARRATFVVPPPIVLKDVPTLEGRSTYHDVAIQLLPHLVAALPPLSERERSTGSPQSSVEPSFATA